MRLRTLCQTAQDSGLKLILLLDDFEFLADRFRLEYRFFSALRGLYTNNEIAYLIASQSPLHTLEQAIPKASPLFNTFYRIILEPLTLEESHALVVTLLEQASVGFPQFAIDCVLELGDNEPYRLQKAGHITFQVWQENGGYLQMKNCEEIRRQFDGERHTERL